MAREVRIAILGDSRDFSRAVANADRDASKLHGSFSRVGSGITNLAKGMAIGVAGIGVGAAVLGKGFIDAAIESQKVSKQTEAVIKSMGGVANVTAAQVGDLSEKLAAQTGIDDELIQSGQNVLLTFGNVKNSVGKGPKIFDRATKAALNMSVALGTDMTSASMMVGKALNDPVKGLAKLARSGVQFSKEQEDQIKTMVLYGKTGEAQAIMLEELERQFGGSAEAQATAGDKLKVIWGNLQEELGEKLLPIFEGVATWLSNNLPRAMETFGRFIGPVIDGAKQLFDIFARRDFTGGPFAEDSPVIDAAFKMRDAIVSFVRDALDALSNWWDNNGDNVINFLKDFGGVLQSAAGFAGNIATIIKDEVLPRLSEFAGWIGDNEARMDIFRGAILGLAGAWGIYSAATAIAAGTTLLALAPYILLGALVVGLTVLTQELADAFDSQLNTAFQWIIDRAADILGFFSDLIDLAVRALAAVEALKQSLPDVDLPGGGGGIPLPPLPGPLDEIWKGLTGADGGVVPGPRGVAQLVMAHGGETLVPTHKPGVGLGGGGVQINGDIHNHYPAPETPSDGVLRITRKAMALAGG